ncbi:glycosyltransferase family 25 protein [Vibrio casei]|uniref:glycosyltransferase family 25 protein n=1 Tax=Vibrio casei TaxID=673372 RepID=UPI003F99D8E9
MSKIYVINLTTSLERADNIRHQLNSLNVDWDFFPAVNGHKEDHPLFQRYDDASSQKYRAKSLSKGQLGCYASHYLLWEKCVELNQPIIILEDDSLIDKEIFLDFIENTKYLDEKYECIRLFSHKRKNFSHYMVKNLEKLSIHLFDKGHMSTTGYYIRPSAAKKFLQHSQKWAFAVDIFMDRFWENDVVVYGTIPDCLTNDPQFDSDITYPDHREKRTLSSTIKREIFSASEHLQRKLYLKKINK